MSDLVKANDFLKYISDYGTDREQTLLKIIEAKDKELEQHKAITEAAKFLVKVKRHKDTQTAWYLASWPIALRKIEEAVDNLGEDNE